MVFLNNDRQELLTDKIYKKKRVIYFRIKFYLFCIEKREHKASGLIINPYPYSFILYAVTSMPLHIIDHIKQSNLYS